MIAAFVSSCRALLSRLGAVGAIFVVAVIAVAAAAAGPTYYAAGQTSVLRDTAAGASVLGRGVEVTQAGPVDSSFASLQAEVSSDLGTTFGLFSVPVEAREASAFYPANQQNLLLASRTGVCSHLVLDGSCPSKDGQVMVTRYLASVNGWNRGQRVVFPTWGPLTITAFYTPPSVPADYWSNQLSIFFPAQFPLSAGGGYDAMFTPAATIVAAPSSVQGSIVTDSTLVDRRLVPVDANRLSSAIASLVGDPQLAGRQAIAESLIPQTMATVRSGWSALAVPVLVVTLELLALAGLLLFLLVTDSMAARGPEVALAKLRGYGRWRGVGFGLSEPVLILAAALPVGVVAGWAATTGLGHILLRPGTPVGLPGWGWAAGAAAAAGGVLAVVAASLHILRRPIVEQWRHSTRRPGRRGWALDGAVVTAAAAGIIELNFSGAVTSASLHPLSLLVPGLVGLAAAVVASRLLPVACTVATRRTSASIASLLALRQVARRPGGARTTIILAASFTLVTFAVSSWLVSQANYRQAAYAKLGAPAVATVTIPTNTNLATLVSRADPTGRHATPVEEYTSGNVTTLAVDPKSWDRIAHWNGHRLSAAQAAAIDPPEASPLILRGDQVRVQLKIIKLSPPGTELTLNVVARNGLSDTPVTFAALPADGGVIETAALPPCPCRVDNLTVDANPALARNGTLTGSLTIDGLDVHTAKGWEPLPAPNLTASRWAAQPDSAGHSTVSSDSMGLGWQFDQPAVDSAVLAYRDRPYPLPAITTSSVSGGHGQTVTATGLDGRGLPVKVITTVAAVPGATSGGIVVDQSYAEMAAAGNLTIAQRQVWMAAGYANAITSRLRAEGVTINSVTTESQRVSALSRSGPGLAQVLFLAEAGAAAALAAGGAVLALYLFARRRRYEMAALTAIGIQRASLARALILEQLVMLTYSALTGITAGLITAALVLRDVPEFISRPTDITLATFPPGPILGVALAAALAVTLAAGATASAIMARTVTLTQLREAPT